MGMAAQRGGAVAAAAGAGAKAGASSVGTVGGGAVGGASSVGTMGGGVAVGTTAVTGGLSTLGVAVLIVGTVGVVMVVTQLAGSNDPTLGALPPALLQAAFDFSTFEHGWEAQVIRNTTWSATTGQAVWVRDWGPAGDDASLACGQTVGGAEQFRLPLPWGVQTT